MPSGFDDWNSQSLRHSGNSKPNKKTKADADRYQKYMMDNFGVNPYAKTEQMAKEKYPFTMGVAKEKLKRGQSIMDKSYRQVSNEHRNTNDRVGEIVSQKNKKKREQEKKELSNPKNMLTRLYKKLKK